MEEEKVYYIPVTATLQIEARDEEYAKEIAEHILYKSDWVVGYDIGDAE